jgi:LacI family transcriptional regulator, galactose operon repressor
MATSPLPKYQSIALEIESRIVSTRGQGWKVPSTRDIAEEHGVSVVTASRALQVLRGKGLIETVGRSRSTLLPEAEPVPSTEAVPVRAAEHYALLLRSTPGPWQAASRSVPLAGFVAAAREQSIPLEVDLFELDESTTRPELHRQARKAADLGVDGLFFMPTRHGEPFARQDESFLAACREAGIAVVLVERNLRGAARPLEYDLVATDDLDGGLVSTRHLIDQGRRRVAFVTGSPTSSHEGRVAGYLAALFEASKSGRARKPMVLEQPSGLTTKAAYEELVDQILAEEVDGVVCYQDYTAVGLMIELLTRRTRVPRDIAITGFDNLPIGNSFALGVTTYDYPALAIARQAVRVMRARRQDPAGPPVKVLVPGRLIIRESSHPSA